MLPTIKVIKFLVQFVCPKPVIIGQVFEWWTSSFYQHWGYSQLTAVVIAISVFLSCWTLVLYTYNYISQLDNIRMSYVDEVLIKSHYFIKLHRWVVGTNLLSWLSIRKPAHKIWPIFRLHRSITNLLFRCSF